MAHTVLRTHSCEKSSTILAHYFEHDRLLVKNIYGTNDTGSSRMDATLIKPNPTCFIINVESNSKDVVVWFIAAKRIQL